MLPLEFILTDAHFAIGMLAALACFATFWLYLDAWAAKRGLKEFLKWLGYAILAFGLMLTAAEVESAFLGETALGNLDWVALVLRTLGYAILAVGLALDPLQPVPVYPDSGLPGGEKKSEVPKKKWWQVWKRKKKAGEVLAPVPVPTGAPPPAAQPVPAQPASAPTPVPVAAVAPSPTSPPASASVPASETKPMGGFAAGLASARFITPLFSGAVLFLYWRRAYTGLERHLKPVMWAFVWFTAFELVDLAALGRSTNDPRLYSIVAPFGPLWIVAQVFLAVGAVVLGLWVWQYLTKRLQTQLFIVLTTACLVIFLVTTVSFTFLLMARVQAQAYDSLKTTAKVLDTAVAGRQAETIAAAEVVAGSSAVANAVVAKDHARLAALEKDFLTSKHQSSLVITTDSAQVLLRAEDPANWGDSVSSDSLVSRALVGKTAHGLIATDGALTPKLVMRSAAPIRNAAGVVVGTVTVGFTVDNAFVDGLKESTGLASAIYSGSVRVATTLAASDGRSRLVGVREGRKDITDTVLKHDKTWSGMVSFGGQSYLAVYAPLHDADNEPVGMLFIGQPQALLLQAAGKSIELTFLISVVLLVLSIAPVHFISKSLAGQLH